MKNERMKFLVNEVNSLTKKKEEKLLKNMPLWDWPNKEGRLIKMYIDEIALLKEQNNKEELEMDTYKEIELVETFIKRLNEREKEREEEMMNKRKEIDFIKEETKEESKIDRVPTELEMLKGLINQTKKEEEAEIMKEEAKNIRLEEIESQKEHIKREAKAADKEIEVWAQEVSSKPVFGKKKDNLVYNKKDKVWMEEGAVFRQISQKDFYNEIKRIRKVFSKLSIREETPIKIAKKYTFNDRDVFVKLFNNMKKGGYVVIRKDSTSITLGKEWYSFRMRANYYHSLEFSKSKNSQYIIGDIRDKRILTDHSKTRKYGRKYLPITRVGL